IELGSIEGIRSKVGDLLDCCRLASDQSAMPILTKQRAVTRTPKVKAVLDQPGNIHCACSADLEVFLLPKEVAIQLSACTRDGNPTYVANCLLDAQCVVNAVSGKLSFTQSDPLLEKRPAHGPPVLRPGE